MLFKTLSGTMSYFLQTLLIICALGPDLVDEGMQLLFILYLKNKMNCVIRHRYSFAYICMIIIQFRKCSVL